MMTSELGIVSVIANGVKSLKNPNLASVQPFCYSSFVLYRKGEMYWLRESQLIENFYGLRSDLEKSALASYLCSVAEDFATDEEDISVIEKLLLNTLYALSNDLSDRRAVKGAFEMRIASELGFLPDLTACVSCGKEPSGDMLFDVTGGAVICGGCRDDRSIAALLGEQGVDPRDASEYFIRIDSNVLSALRYVTACRQERLFSFRLDDSSYRVFSKVCENYIIYHTDRRFRTLDFYKSVCSDLPDKP